MKEVGTRGVSVSTRGSETFKLPSEPNAKTPGSRERHNKQNANQNGKHKKKQQKLGICPTKPSGQRRPQSKAPRRGGTTRGGTYFGNKKKNT